MVCHRLSLHREAVMNTLYSRAVIRLGIDKIRIKLSHKRGKGRGIDLTTLLFGHIKLRIYPQYKKKIAIYRYDGCYNIKDKHVNRRIAKVYKTRDGSCMIELMGTCQTFNLFELSDYHRILLTIIGRLDVKLTLEATDISQDFFYPFSRSFVLDEAKRRDWIELLTYQTSFPMAHLTDIPMTTIRAPRAQRKLLRFAIKHGLKLPDKKKHGDCYYRWVEASDDGYGEVYKPCEKENHTHYEIKINDRKLYYKISKLFDGTEAFSSDYDPDTETNISRKPKQVSKIKYDKYARDLKKHGRELMDKVYNKLIDEIAENQTEHDELKKTIRGSHTRVEDRFHKPSVKQRDKHTLNLRNETSYDTLTQTIKDEIKKISIFILKPEVSTDAYLDLYKQRLKKVNTCEKLTPDEYGRILEVDLDSLDKQIATLKEFFNVEPESPIKKVLTTPIKKSKNKTTRKRVLRGF